MAFGHGPASAGWQGNSNSNSVRAQRARAALRSPAAAGGVALLRGDQEQGRMHPDWGS